MGMNLQEITENQEENPQKREKYRRLSNEDGFNICKGIHFFFGFQAEQMS